MQQAIGLARKQGIEYGLAPSPLGLLLFAWIGQQLCRMSFASSDNRSILKSQLIRQWPQCDLTEVDHKALHLVQDIYHNHQMPTSISILLHGTVFQLAVWKSMLSITSGQTITYSSLDTPADYARPSRAVGPAIVHNPIFFSITCYRVTRTT